MRKKRIIVVAILICISGIFYLLAGRLNQCSNPDPPDTIESSPLQTLILQDGERQWNISLSPDFDEEMLLKELQKINTQIEQPVKNEKWDFLNQVVIPGEAGRSVDLDATLKLIKQRISEGSPEPVSLVIELLEPTKVPDYKNENYSERLARYSTYFDPENEGRTNNIKLAANMLNDIIVAPQDEFSFNKVVGPTSQEKGFQNALVIVNQEFVMGLGGGVCQVSTTLYNSALLSGMEIAYRKNHSLPVGYIPLGRDAAVYYDSLDFRFRNPYDFPIQIKTEVSENRLSIAIYAPQPIDTSYRIEVGEARIIEPEVKIIPDPTLPKGEEVVAQQGRQGYQVEVYRIKVQNKQELRELVSKDIYPEQPKVVYLGI